jgi:Flp pilus assembly protein TadG
VAIVFSLCLFPLLALGGLAIDYSGALKARTSLQAALDAAALEAVSDAFMSQTIESARRHALESVPSFLPADLQASVKAIAVTISETNGLREATVTAGLDYETRLIAVAGVKSFSIQAQARSSGTKRPYIDFYMLLDNSPSMGIGATTADIDKMVKNTSDQCAFACHQMDKPTTDYYSLAKKLGVSLRIDVVRLATQNLVDTAVKNRVYSGQFRMAVYTFGPRAENDTLTNVAPLSSDLTAVKTQADKVDLMTIPYAGYRNDTQTNFDAIFQGMNRTILSAGDGSSANTPQKVLFFVSDGVNDAPKTTCTQPLIGGSPIRCQEPLNPALCNTLKARGVKIAVLYTTYQPLPTNWWYNNTIKPFQPQIGPNMKACASDGLYFEVSPTQGISDAMNALFMKALQKAKITA